MASQTRKNPSTIRSFLSKLFFASRSELPEPGWRRTGRRASAIRRVRRYPSIVESLEVRALLSTFSVTSTADSGAGTLRQAVSDANSSAGIDTIVFDSLFDSVQTITLTSGELALNDSSTTTIIGPGAKLLSISGNSGGRVFLVTSGASAELSGMTITGGSGVFIGGGVRNDGTLTISSITMSGNSGDHGGGFGNTGTAIVTNSTFTSNSAANEGGGLENYGVLTLTNSTIAGNTSTRGGGIANAGSGWINVTNSTVSGNSASSSGGGLDNISGTVTLSNTIIASQTLGGDIAGGVSGSNNLIGTGGSGGLVNGMNGNIVGVSVPGLSALADNGGPTRTMALLPSSPAINAGDITYAPLIDQRSLFRFGNTDIGAFEYQFKVTSNADSGNGSLRQAITNANTTVGTDTVVFRIGSGLQTIAPASSLPTISQTIVIDGSSQTGFAGTPLIRINGSGAGNADGMQLDVGSDGSTIKGLIISNFSSIARFGIVLGSANNIIQGNWIGLDSAGTAAAPNWHGILLGTGNLIGTNGDGVNDTAERNVISGNLQHGVLGNGGSNSRIAGNYIGTNAAGDAPLFNSFSNVFMQFTSGNIIGTDGSNDAFNANERNVIANEVLVSGDTVVAGNYIGLNADGTAALSAVAHLGIQFGNAIAGGRIGTNADGIADSEERNVISGLNGPGIISGSSGPLVIAGNTIGTNPAGTAAISNQRGIVLTSSSTGARIGTNADGVNDAAEANLISGNLVAGVLITNTSHSNLVAGNMIGTNSAGTAALGNATGIQIDAGSSNNIIGGSVAAARNVISGNSGSGVTITGSGTNSNTVLGNYIGTNNSGAAALGNGGGGVLIRGGATNNRIGGSTVGERNVISGNTGGTVAGVTFSDAGTTNNRAQGNFIGTDATGASAIPNHFGVFFYSNANGNFAGTDGDGLSDATEGNVISGNSTGVWVQTNADNNVIAGNLIGTNAAGTGAINNTSAGIRIFDSSVNGTRIGTDGNSTSDTEERNIISGNNIGVFEAAGVGTIIAGNYIGLGADGSTIIANITGISLTGGSGAIIGAFTATPGTAGGNVISGNSSSGISINGSQGEFIRGNLIGTDQTGQFDRGNVQYGILIANGLPHTIGGDDDDDGLLDGVVRARNVVSGNNGGGIQLSGGPSYVTIQGNYIGTNINGTSGIANGVGNANAGIAVASAYFVTIGGTTAGAGNVISGNFGTGIATTQANAADQTVTIQGNYIGTNAAGTALLANTLDGISSNNPFPNSVTIGGTVANAGNLISGNTRYGVNLSGTTGALVQGNRIGTDAAGTAAIANATGVLVQSGATGTIIGAFTTTPGTLGGNLISGNSGISIQLVSGTGNGTRIRGNILGLASDGLTDISSGDGIRVNGGTGALIGGDDDDDGTLDGVIQARNIISGFALGLNLSTSGSVLSTQIRGNYIGTDITGTVARANGQGVGVGNAPGTTVGGLTAGSGNLISGNAVGVSIYSTNGNSTVQGNLIGTRANGVQALANGTGVSIINAGNTIGGITIEARNIIAGNTNDGVIISGSSATSNTVIGNWIGLNTAGAALSNATGVTINNGAANNTIGGTAVAARNVISGNASQGVLISGVGTSGNTVAGNFIGVDVTGVVALANSVYGILIQGAPANRIGGVVAGARNIVSGNADRGIVITGSGADNNVVIGNFVGTDVNGTNAIGNGTEGVIISYGAKFNRVGTDGDGVNDAAERNVLSGNVRNGLQIEGIGADQNIVAGNYIGTTSSGTVLLGNGLHGIIIFGTASGNRIGTDGSNDAFNANERNIIAGSAQYGVRIRDVGTSGNIVSGNYIGTDVTGTVDFGNALDGIILLTGTTGNRIGTDANGVNDALEANVISGNNRYGVYLTGSGTRFNTVAGNFIGTSAAGTAAIANSNDGVRVDSSASQNTIGGSTAASRNVISGNSGDGIEINGSGSANNVVIGNYIGVNAAGTAAVGNTQAGVNVSGGANGNTIGGSVVGAGNVISGSLSVGSGRGVLISGVGTSLNVVKGNYIGLDATGMTAVANANSGVLIASGASNNTIGGPNPADRNVISGNVLAGIAFQSTGTSGNTAQGNWVGLNAAGTAAVANQAAGLAFIDNSTANSSIANVISGNLAYGIGILKYNTAFGSHNNTILGNLIGTDPTGMNAIPNVGIGISIGDGSSGNIVGGTTPEHRNVISGNSGSGVVVNNSTTGNVLSGNFIGVNAAGTAALGNSVNGLTVHGTNNTIGGVVSGAGNVISGNQQNGILFGGTGTRIQGNFIGTNASGTTAIPNQGGLLSYGGSGWKIGGDDDDDGSVDGVVKARNIISGNTSLGIQLETGGYESGVIQGNFIGTDVTGLTAIPNISGIGAHSTSGVTVGGTTPGAGNVIAGNTLSGIAVISAATAVTEWTIQANLIGLGADGSTTLGHSQFGIEFRNNGAALDVTNILIGGTLPGSGNVISGNGTGIRFDGSTVFNNVIAGNSIGTDAAGTTARPNGVGIVLTNGAHDTTIGGITTAARNLISGNANYGVHLDNAGTGNVVRGNYIGTDATGTIALGNGLDGILGYSSGTTIGGSLAGAGNVISGNLRHGMDIGGDSNTISGNFIGTNASGIDALQNGLHGISSYSNNSIIGGFTPADRNIIVAAQAGVSLSSSSNTRISGNYIGTDVTGTRVLASGNPIGINMTGHPAASDITIGGGEPGAGNVINVGAAPGTYGIGVWIQHTGGSGNKVQGNFIGTDPTGSFRVGNNWGVLVDWQNDVVIGTDSDGLNDATEGNLISGNVNGVMFGGFGGGSITGTIIAGNLIGSDATGTQVIGNSQDGLQLNSYGSTRVGTDSDGTNDENESNVIAGSGRAGVWFSGDNTLIAGNFIGTDRTQTRTIPNTYGIIAAFGTGHTIGGVAATSRNVIANSTTTGLKFENGTDANGTYVNNIYYGNLGLAIDAGGVGRTLNDAPDADGLLNYPVLTGASFVGGNLILEGFVDAGRTVEFFVSSASSDGIGQGQRLIASLQEGSAADQNATTGIYGPIVGGRTVSTGPVTANRFRFQIPIPATVFSGTPFTAVALGSTSEFSPILSAGEVGSSLAPQISLDRSAISLSTGESIEVRGSFYDPDSLAWTATVDYGDGTGIQPLHLKADQSFDLKHTYVNAGNYTVTVRVTDNSLTSSTRTLTVNVANEAPTATFNSFTITSPASEGQLVTLIGQFEDTSGTYTATIEWGDGQTSAVTQNLTPAGQIVFLGGGKYEIRATHVYLDDSNSTGSATPADVYRVWVTVSDNSGGTDTTPIGLFLEEVRNLIPQSANVALSSTAIFEGQAVSLSGSFMDAGILDVHTVRVGWGDGTESLMTLPVGVRSFAGLPQLTHVYLDDPALGADEYVITVSIADDDQPESPVTLTRTISVANAVPVALNAVLNATVIDENGFVGLSGSFFDTGLSDTHTLTVDWGDGSSESVFGLAKGIFSFSGVSHQYLDNPAAGSTFQITVRVSDNDSPNQFATLTQTVTVNNVAPTVGDVTLSSGGAPLDEGDWLTISGSYDDVSGKDRHQVRIFWGDGLSSLASVDSSTRTFSATHQYGDNGTLTWTGPGPIPFPFPHSPSQIQIEVTDDDGLSSSAFLTQQVDNVVPEVSVTPDANNSDPAIIRLNALVADVGYLDMLNITWQAWPVDAPGSVQSFSQSSPNPGSLFSSFTIDRRLHPNYNSTTPNVFPAVVWRVVATATDDDGGSFSYETATLVGTSGNDILVIDDNTFASAGTTSLIVLGLDGSDIIDGTNVLSTTHQLILDGGNQTDWLFGGAGNDLYYLWRGDDNANVPVSGGPTPIELGNDVYRMVPNSTLTVIDRSGTNTLDFGLADFGNQSGVSFDLDLANSVTLQSQDVSALHTVSTLGQFRSLVGSRFGDTLTGASASTVDGGAGNDRFTVKADTSGATFRGGADDDILTVTGTNITSLNFGGDDGSDLLVNAGTISGLTFNGGADDDILRNTGIILSTLNFGGDDGVDSLFNEGTISSLTFGGGADDDLLQNVGTIVTSLNFGGDDGADVLLNAGSITSLTFNGGADDDIFFNNGATPTTLNFGGDDDLLLTGTGTIGTLNFGGDDGADIFVNLSTITTLTFNGGADDDLFINNGTVPTSLNFGGDDDIQLSGVGTISTLTFGGDDGSDTLVNAGSISSLTFGGGADDDLLQNSGIVLVSLNFGGDDGIDGLFNTGSIASLTFNGGADDDLLINNGPTPTSLNFGGDDDVLLSGVGTIASLNFGGDAGADVLVNLGTLTILTFNGGADDDLLINAGPTVTTLSFGGDDDILLSGQGTVLTLNFGGDEGSDTLQNFGTVASLMFGGGADDDLLINTGTVTGTLNFGGDDDILVSSGGIATLNFSGDEGSDTLLNLGSVGTLTFGGGADDDILENTGTVLVSLNFGGDDGSDILWNSGAVATLTFGGGADDDLLINTGTVGTSLNFGGDDGTDLLQNSGTITTLTFNGGADDDLLINVGTGMVTTLNFGGDDGSDTLQNFGTVNSLTFGGGADDDLLVNNGTVVTSLNFGGDDGADVLLNRGSVTSLTFGGGADDDILFNSGSVTSLTFNGGADDDVLLNNGNNIASLNFGGDDGVDVLVNNGSSIVSLTFNGGADDDLLISNGQNITTLSFTGDSGTRVAGRTSDDTLIVRGSGSGTATSSILFDGGYGIDAFENNAVGFATITFQGGLDDDALLNNAPGLASLNFRGDDGSDVLVNHGGSIISLTFNGGADDDIFVNDGTGIVTLTFNGGADDDLLINSGDQLATMTFNGGADDDLLVNQGNQIVSLTFNGGADDDVLINDGAFITTLSFGGDAGNDRFWNRKTGVGVNAIQFHGDDGSDVLINDAAGIVTLNFSGDDGADVLQNNGSVATLTFNGGADDDIFVNAGSLTSLTFNGGADDDILLNRGTGISTLNFGGDEGSDTLFNLGAVTSLTFNGGADDDVLQNSGPVVTLNFGGDDGSDLLVNNASVGTLTFGGGADDDTLQNNSSVVSLTFNGGADDDVLVNNGNNISTLNFGGDDGTDTLINNGSSIASLTFNGGADGDTLRIHGRNIGTVEFEGGDGSDSFAYNGTGTASSVITFSGSGGNDFFAMRGTAGVIHFDGGSGDDSVMIVGSAAMFMTGGAGDDMYRFVNNPPADVTLLDSYTGPTDRSRDTLDFSSFSGGVVNLDLRLVNVWQAQGNGQLRVLLADDMAVENVVGSSFGDTIYGNARSNYIGGADFDETFTGPVAAPRGATQWVLLDFGTYTNTGTVDPVTGLPDLGEYVYSLMEQEQIRQRVESVYRGPNAGAPWFDLRVVTDLADIPSAIRSSSQFATVFFNRTPDFGRPGGLASEIDPGNANLRGFAVVQVNGLLGGVITGVDADDGHVEDASSIAGYKGDHSKISDVEVGAIKPAATSDNFVRLSSKVAAHELGHLLGLRHQDSFGPIGSGLHDPPGAGAYKPVYTGPSGGVETFDHIIGSPASVGSTRFDDLNDLFFGEREAIKLAFANSDPSATTRNESTSSHDTQASAEQMVPVTLAVPNTLSRGLNQPKDFFVQLGAINGSIELGANGRSQSDWYSFTGRAGELINIDIFSNSLARYATGPDGTLLSDDFIDTIVRVYDASGYLVPYYNGVAVNDDMFEPTDSSLIDLLLPADGTYFIEVDSFHRFGDPLGDPSNPINPLNPDNPNNIRSDSERVARFIDSINDTDTGKYQLIMYKFRKASASDGIDDLKGFGGVDIINGGPGDSFLLEYSLGATATVFEGSSFSRSVTVNDRAASDWTGSTVNFGDSFGTVPLTVSSSGEFNLNHVWADNGNYVVTVTIVNDIGHSLTQMSNVTVDNANPVPSIDSISATRVEGGTISFAGSATDPAGSNDTLTYVWNFGDGSLGVFGANSEYIYSDNGTYVVTLTVTDEDGGSASTTQTITVTDVNEAPTAVVLQNTTTSLPENTSTANAIKVAEILVTDDALGTNQLSLSGLDAVFFEIADHALWIKAGTVLDFETKSNYSVTVNVDDLTVGGTPDASRDFNFMLLDIIEDMTPPTASFVAISTARISALGVVTLNFSEAVTGVDLADLSLTRNGSTVSLAGRTLTKVAPAQYTIDLTSVTAAGGDYVLTLAATGSAIADLAGNALTQSASLNWSNVKITGFQVQNGEAQRSYVRYVNVTFAGTGGLTGLINGGRVKLKQYDLKGLNPVAAGTGTLTVVGNQLRIDFGVQGIGGNRLSTSYDGYYRLELDLDGNGSLDDSRRFYRLLGDFDGNRAVNKTDVSLFNTALTQPYNSLYDIDGNGVLNANDRTKIQVSVKAKRKLLDTLIIDN